MHSDPVRTANVSETSLATLAAEITTLAAHLNAGTYRFLVLIVDFDRREGWGGWGIRSCAHWLSWKCGIGLNAAREQLRVAHALGELPLISDAMRSGQLSYTKVRAMTRVATRDTEKFLLAIAQNGTASHIETVVRHHRRTHRIEELRRDAVRHDARCLRYFWDHDGCLVIEGRLPPEQGAVVERALKAADAALMQIARDSADAKPASECTARPQSAKAGDEQQRPITAPHCADAPPEKVSPAIAAAAQRPTRDPEEQEALERLEVALQQAEGDHDRELAASADLETPVSSASAPGPFEPAGRSRAARRVSAETSAADLSWRQRQADAFSLVAETFLAHDNASRSGADKHLVHVHVDLEALCSAESDGRSAIEDGPSIPPETVRRLCCDAGLVTWLDDGGGKTLDVGRKTRIVPAALRRLLQKRDGGCRFPGCEQRRFVDAHHIDHWADGGATEASNLVLLCRRHHRLLHEGGVRIEGRAPDVRFVRPDGRVLPAAPQLPRVTDEGGLSTQHASLGLAIHARTAVSGWRGERADYTYLLTVLDQHERKAPLHSARVATR